jgi:hypothetical protein
MTCFGIMTLNNHIPYKRPVLKSLPYYGNARGVLRELNAKHGGLYSTKSDTNNPLNNENSQYTNKNRPKSSGGNRLSSAIINGRI